MSELSDYQRREIEGILQEIAADPDAKLLRVPPAENLLALADQPKVGVVAAGLSSAERYLLETHREELAYLLRERCVMEFYAQPDADLNWHRSLEDRGYEFRAAAEWGRRTRDGLSAETADPTARPARDALASCVDVEVGHGPGVSELAAASLRVVPHDSARLYLAMEMARSGRQDDCRRTCHEILEQRPSGQMASSCWEIIGFSFSNQLRHAEASHAYRESAMAEPDRLAPIVFWCTTSLESGDRLQVEEASKWVVERVPQSHRINDWVRSRMDALNVQTRATGPEGYDFGRRAHG